MPRALSEKKKDKESRVCSEDFSPRALVLVHKDSSSLLQTIADYLSQTRAESLAFSVYSKPLAKRPAKIGGKPFSIIAAQVA